MPEIPKLGLASGFGIIGFGATYIVTDRWFKHDVWFDMGSGAIIGGLAWMVIILMGARSR